MIRDAIGTIVEIKSRSGDLKTSAAKALACHITDISPLSFCVHHHARSEPLPTPSTTATTWWVWLGGTLCVRVIDAHRFPDGGRPS